MDKADRYIGHDFGAIKDEPQQELIDFLSSLVLRGELSKESAEKAIELAKRGCDEG